MKKIFLSALILATTTTPIKAIEWTTKEKQTFVGNCVSRSMAQQQIRNTWPAHLIGQVCDCIRQTLEAFSRFEQFNSVFTDNITRQRGQQSMYVVATACVGFVRQQQAQRQTQPGLNGWEGFME